MTLGARTSLGVAFCGSDPARRKVRTVTRDNCYKMGRGSGTRVVGLVTTSESANGLKVDGVHTPRHTGDVASVFVDVDNADQILGWKAKRHLIDMCRDSSQSVCLSDD